MDSTLYQQIPRYPYKFIEKRWCILNTTTFFFNIPCYLFTLQTVVYKLQTNLNARVHQSVFYQLKAPPALLKTPSWER